MKNLSILFLSALALVFANVSFAAITGSGSASGSASGGATVGASSGGVNAGANTGARAVTGNPNGSVTTSTIDSGATTRTQPSPRTVNSGSAVRTTTDPSGVGVGVANSGVGVGNTSNPATGRFSTGGTTTAADSMWSSENSSSGVLSTSNQAVRIHRMAPGESGSAVSSSVNNTAFFSGEITTIDPNKNSFTVRNTSNGTTKTYILRDANRFRGFNTGDKVQVLLEEEFDQKI